MNTTIRYLVIFVAIAVTLSAATKSSYSYPTSVSQSVPAKWAHLHFSICTAGNADERYEKLFIGAIEQWKSAWPHFSYAIYGNQQNCDVNVDLTKYSVGLPKERKSQGTTKVAYWPNGHIISADITIPTQIKKDVKQGNYCCKELMYTISEKKFLLVALQEFGHALGLGHAEDDGKEPFDVMSSTAEHNEHVISAITIKALDNIYGTTTQTSDHAITIKPSVTLAVKMDKDLYVFDDIVKVSGKVSKLGGSGKVMLLKLLDGYPSMSLNAIMDFVPDDNGSFAVDVDLKTQHSGKWMLLVQYLEASKSVLFDVEETPYQAYGQTDRTSYSIGDLVKINGSVTRYGDKLYINVINPDGINFAHTVAPISSDKKFDAEFALKESKFTVEGKWTVSLIYGDSINDFTFVVEKAASTEQT